MRSQRGGNERSKLGYGGKPTHESKPAKKSTQPFSSMKLPIVKGIMNGTSVIYTKLPLTMENESFKFDDDLTPTEPLMPGLPKPDHIKVHVHCRLTQIEPK
jgi:hypothetical protein